MRLSITIVSLLLLLAMNSASAQILTSCGVPSPSGTRFCQQSCIHCDLNGKEDKNDLVLPGPSGTLCNGTIVMRNPRWYGFVPSTPSVIFSINPLNCNGPDGLQAAITQGCNTSFPIACNAGAVGGAGTSITIAADGLTPGAPYQLLVNGLNTNICGYIIKVESGSLNPLPLGVLGNIQGPTQVCPNATVTYTIPPVANASTYTWSAPPGSSIDGGGNTKVYQAPAGTTVTIKFGQLGGAVTVVASNVCNPAISKSIIVSNQPLAPVTLPDEVLCYDALPYTWPEEPFNQVAAPGTYNFISTPYASYLGCDSIVKQKVTIRPAKIKFLPPTYICDGECFQVGFSDYCNTGNYEEVIPAADGCDSTIIFSVFKIAANAAAQNVDTITCYRPSVQVTSNGSTTGNQITYTWQNAGGTTVATGATATIAASGEYMLIVGNNVGGKTCRDTATVFVPANNDVPLAQAGPGKVVSCSQPTAQLSGNGSMGPQYSYLWTATQGGNIISGGSTLTPTVNAPGRYELRVTNTYNGCQGVSIMFVTANVVPPSASAVGGTVDCLHPTLTIQTTSNAPNPSFSWSGPNGFVSTAQNPMVTAGGTYTVTVTNGNNGCTNTTFVNVADNTQLPDVSAFGGTLTCTTQNIILGGGSSTPNVTYKWTGPNGFTSTQASPNVNTQGNYVLTVTSQNGCTASATAVVNLDNTLPATTVAPSGVLNCNASQINLIANTAGGSSFSYVWQKPDGSSESTGTTPILVTNVAGQYNVVVTNNANGCSATTNATVVKRPVLAAMASTAQNVSCFGGQNGALMASASGGDNNYAFAWNSGQTTANINNLAAGAYTLTVTDGDNCTATAAISVGQPSLLETTATATPQTANNATDGTATVAVTGGTPPFTYNWSNGASGTPVIQNLLPGAYSVTVTDGNGCTTVQTANVNSYNCTFAGTVSNENVSCFGANDASASLNFTGQSVPVEYAWSTGATTPTINGLAPGQYSVSATDSKNCQITLNFAVSEPVVLEISASGNNALGPNTNDGTASASAIGGSGNYSFAWSNGETTAAVSGLAPGAYSVVVTDANGCTSSTAVTIGVDCNLSSDVVASEPTCSGADNGSLIVAVTGGIAPFTYNWTSGSDSTSAAGLVAGTYSITATDANGCETTATATLAEPAPVTITTASVTSTSCGIDPTGSATVAGAGGTGTLTYTWSNDQAGETITGLVAGDYTVTATDENGCTGSHIVTVGANDTQAPIIQIAPSHTLSIGQSGTVSPNVNNLAMQILENCGVSSIVFEPSIFNCSEQGEHLLYITVTDNSGNITNDTVTVTVIDDAPPTMGCSPSIMRCFGDDLVTYTLPTADDNCPLSGGTFDFPNGLPSGSQFPVGVTTNTYTYTDAGGNIGTCSFEVTILTQVAVAVGTVKDDIGSQGIGSISIIASGGLSPYTFQWKKDGVNFSTMQNLTGLFAGTYTVEVVDNFGCTVQSQTIVVNDLVSTQQPEWANSVMLYPNPTTGLFQITFPADLASEAQVVVYDVVGRKVATQSFATTGKVELDLSAQAEGLYTVLIQIGQGRIVRKIALQRD